MHNGGHFICLPFVSDTIQILRVVREYGVTKLLPTTPIPEAAPTTWFHMVSKQHVNKIMRDIGTSYSNGPAMAMTGMRCVGHVLELSSVSMFRDEQVGDGLIIQTPFRALYVFLRGAHLGTMGRRSIRR